LRQVCFIKIIVLKTIRISRAINVDNIYSVSYSLFKENNKYVVKIYNPTYFKGHKKQIKCTTGKTSERPARKRALEIIDSYFGSETETQPTPETSGKILTVSDMLEKYYHTIYLENIKIHPPEKQKKMIPNVRGRLKHLKRHIGDVNTKNLDMSVVNRYIKELESQLNKIDSELEALEKEKSKISQKVFERKDIELIKKVEQLKSEIDSKTNEIDKNKFASKLYKKLSLFTDALVCANLGMNIAESNKDSESLCYFCNEIGEIYINLGKTYLALGYIMAEKPQDTEDMLKEVSEFCNTYDEAFIGAPASLFYGLVLSAKGQINLGINVLETARKEFEVNNRKFFLSFSELMIAITILKLITNPDANGIIRNESGQKNGWNYLSLENVKERLITSIQISEEIGSLFVSGQGYLSLGHIYAIEKNFNDAKKSFDEAVKAFDTCELEALSSQAKDALSSIAEI